MAQCSHSFTETLHGDPTDGYHVPALHSAHFPAAIASRTHSRQRIREPASTDLDSPDLQRPEALVVV